MTKFKKLLALILSVMMIVSALPLTIGAAGADYTMTLTADKTSYKAGETVALDVTISGLMNDVSLVQYSVVFDAAFVTTDASNARKPACFDADWFTLVKNEGGIGYINTPSAEVAGNALNVSVISTAGYTIDDGSDLYGAETAVAGKLLFTVNADIADVSKIFTLTNAKMAHYVNKVQTEKTVTAVQLVAPVDEEVEAVIAAIDEIGEVTLDKEDAIIAAKEAYEALSDAQKELVTNYAVLEDAIEELDELKQEAAGPDSYAIKWAAGHDSGQGNNKTGILATDCMDIPYTIISANGTVLNGHGNIGYDRGYYMELASNGHRLCFEITPRYTGIYKLDVEMGSSGDKIYAYVNKKDEAFNEIGYITVNTGRESTFEEKTVSDNIALVKDVTYRVAFSNKNDAGSSSTAIRYCTLSLMTEAGDEPAMVDELIDAIGEVTLDSEDAIIEAEDAYDALDETQKQFVANYDVLVAAREKFEILKEAEENRAVIEPVVDAIDAIGEVTLEKEAAIKAAEDLYNALAEDKKHLVTNYDVLVDAKERLSELKKEAADREAADAVIELIEAIGDVTEDSELAIVTAENAFDELTAIQKDLVSNYDVLVAARKAYNELVGIEEVPDYIIKWMGGYTSASQGNENGTLSDGYEDIPYYITNVIDGPSVSFGNLGGNWGYAFNISGKGYLHFDITPEYSGVYKLEVVTASNLGSSIAAYQDKVRCGEIEIAATGDDIGNWHPLTEIAKVVLEEGKTTTISFSKAVASANSLGLKDCVLTLVTQSNAKVENAISAIDAIGTVTLDSEADIAAAEEAYSVLTNNERLLVKNYDVLEEAKATLEALKEEAENMAAAQTVIDLIDEIGEVTEESEAEIVAAEEAYIALTPAQREYVTNYDVLVAARETYNEITGSTDTPDIPEVPDVIPEDYEIKWMGGYTDVSQGKDGGNLADGYEDIPFYVTLQHGGEHKSYGHLGGDWTYAFQISNAGYLNFDITPEYSGMYQLDIVTTSKLGGKLKIYKDGVEAGVYVAATTGEDLANYTPLKTAAFLELEAGKTVTISFAKVTNTVTVKDCILSAAKPFEYKGASISEGQTIGRSTDAIELYFTRSIIMGDDAEVTLTDSEGNPVNATVAVREEDSTIVDVILNESLKYNTTYTLRHVGLADGFGNKIETEETITFTVAEKANDTISINNSTVAIDAISVAGTRFTVTGTVYGSLGQTIAGRKVVVYIKIPGMTDKKTIPAVVTNAEGKFTAVYTLVDDEASRSGEYTFIAEEEYHMEAELVKKTARYVSEADKTEVIGGIQNATTATEIEQIINGSNDYGTSNKEIANVDVEKVNALGNKTDFYNRLVGETFTDENGNLDEEVFKDAWNLAYNLENIAQTTDSAVTELTFDGAAPDEQGNTSFSYEEAEEFITEINLDLNKYLFLSPEKKAEFIAEVTSLPRQETAEAFGIECEKLLNDIVAEDNAKEDLAPATANANAYVGNVAKVDLALPAAVEDVEEYTITVGCVTADAAKNIDLAVNSATVTKTVEADGVTVTFTVKNSAKLLSSLGTLTSSRLTAGTDTFTVQGGTVTYGFDKATVNAYGRDIEITPVLTDAILGTTFTVTTAENSANKPSYGSTVTTGKGSISGGGSAPVVTPSTSGDNNVNAQGFTDLAGVEWAESSIMTLFKKGIISPAADGKFRPTDNVTRAEFVKMLVTALRITDKTASVTLSDVAQNDWFYSYVAAAVNYGLVLGDEKGNFRPNDAITRQDVCVIISRAMDKLGYAQYSNNAELFYDDGNISDYAKNAVYRMRAHEIVNGVGDGTFAPLSNANRAATAKMIEKFMKEANI